jgi:ribose transport system permease protein
MTATQSTMDRTVDSDEPHRSGPGIRRLITPTVGAYLAAVALLLVGEALHRGFLNSGHLSTLVALISVLGIVAAGQTIVIVTGGIDLSVGATLTFAEVMSGYWIQGHTGRWPVLLLVIGVAALIGLANAAGITALGIQPLIMTLGAGAVTSGAVLVLTNGSSTGRPPKFLAEAMTRSGWLSSLLLLWLVVSIVTYLLLHRSKSGRQMFAIGTNPRVARLAGIRQSPTLYGVYVFSAVTAALAGIALAGYTGSGDFGVGDTYLFPSIGAVVIGGTSILGGRGSYVGTIAGVPILGTIDSILTLSNIAAAGRQIATGLAILVILVLYARERRLRQ